MHNKEKCLANSQSFYSFNRSFELKGKPADELVPKPQSLFEYDNYVNFGRDRGLSLPITSPIYSLQFLKKGWDDNSTPPLTNGTLQSAELIWRDVRLKRTRVGTPEIQPGPGDFVEFQWSTENDQKRLVLWVYGTPQFNVEYTLEGNGAEVISSGEVDTLHGAVALVDQYAELR